MSDKPITQCPFFAGLLFATLEDALRSLEGFLCQRRPLRQERIASRCERDAGLMARMWLVWHPCWSQRFCCWSLLANDLEGADGVEAEAIARAVAAAPAVVAASVYSSVRATDGPPAD